MKVKKFRGHLITDQKPKIGDDTICTNRKSCNYGLISPVHTLLIENDDWKVIIPQHNKFDILKIVADTKKLKKAFEKTGTFWTITALLDSVIDQRENAVLPWMREVCLQFLPQDK